MAEAVTIIAVLTTAVLGVGNLVAAASASSRERRWRAAEERATELRAVLEEGSERLTRLMLAIDDAHGAAGEGSAFEDARAREMESIQKELAIAGNKIGVRRSSRAIEYTSFGDCWRTMGELIAILEEAPTGFDGDQERAYARGWDQLRETHHAFLDATAQALGVEATRPWWKRSRSSHIARNR